LFLFYFFYFWKKIQLVEEAHWLFDLNCRTRKHFFLGFPIIQALYGAEGKTAIVDQPGTFVSTLGILVATLLFRGEQNGGQILKKFLFSRHLLLYSSLFVECIWF
jgi:hypothetical protein